MKTKIIVGNWKMNHTINQVDSFIKELGKKISSLDKQTNKKVRIMIAPSYPFLYPSLALVKDSSVEIIAQNTHEEEFGAFTGEVSSKMLYSIGVRGVIIGHSERRTYYLEDNKKINKKIKRAIENKLNVILCIGENLLERDQGKHFEVIEKQLQEALFSLHIDQIKSIILAYEPVWAIGTGKNAQGADIKQMHTYIKDSIRKKYDGLHIPVLYGGSLNAKNAKEILEEENIDGGLIGGASLEVNDFFSIIEIASKS